MCLIALAIGQHPRFPVVVASNRDEFFDRPAAPLDWWPSETAGAEPALLAGRDLNAGGTWFGLSRAGRLAMITNVREPDRVRIDAPSRGELVAGWLQGREDFPAHWQALPAQRYNGFNLIAADLARDAWHYASNRTDGPQPLRPGVHGLSNARLDTPWPKVEALRQRMRAAILAADDSAALTAALFEALADRHIAPDRDLPRTGVPLDLERQLAPAFIAMPARGYGTRCSTVLIVERHPGRRITRVVERSHGSDGLPVADRAFTLEDWPAPA